MRRIPLGTLLQRNLFHLVFLVLEEQPGFVVKRHVDDFFSGALVFPPPLELAVAAAVVVVVALL